MAKNPDPMLELTSLKGSTRTLDDWLTMFHLCLVVLPDRPEAALWQPVISAIFKVLGDADCRVAVCITANSSVARRILGDAADEYLVFLDPDRTFVHSLGLEHLPAFVHLRQDTTLAAVAQGWDAPEWQKVATGISKAMKWSVPQLSTAGGPPTSPGWAVTPV